MQAVTLPVLYQLATEPVYADLIDIYLCLRSQSWVSATGNSVVFASNPNLPAFYKELVKFPELLI